MLEVHSTVPIGVLVVGFLLVFPVEHKDFFDGILLVFLHRFLFVFFGVFNEVSNELRG